MFQSINIKVVILVTLLNLFFSLRIFASYYLSSFTSFSVDTLSRYVQIKGLFGDLSPSRSLSSAFALDFASFLCISLYPSLN